MALSVSWLLLAAALIAAAAMAIARARARMRRTRAIESGCARARRQGAILVVLPTRHPRRAARAIFSAFEAATCPWRVAFAVYNESAEDVMEHYERESARHTVGDFRSRVRVRSTIQATSAGALCAAREATAQLHQDERFLLLLDDGATLLEGWDFALCAQWAELGDADGVLSVPPRVVGAAGDAHVKEEAGAAAHAQRMLKVASADSAPRARAPAFPVLGAFKHRLPAVGRVPFPTPPAYPARALAASAQFAFMPTKVFAIAVERAPATFSRPVAPYAADVALSSALHGAGGRMYAPTRELCVSSGADTAFRPAGWAREGLGAKDVDAAYAQFAGIDLARRLVSGRSRMGLLLDESEGSDDEILVKYGTRTEFERIKRSLCGS